MVKFAVALDDNSISQDSFKVALRHAIPNKGDRLLLVSIVDKVHADPNDICTSFVESKQHRIVNEAHVLLLKFGQEAAAKGVDCEIVVAASESPARELCKIIQNLKVDVLVMGRHHSPGFFSRFFGDSTLNYCIDNAPCNVLVVNNEYEIPTLRRKSKVGLAQSGELPTVIKVSTPKSLTPKGTPVKTRKASVQPEVPSATVEEPEAEVVLEEEQEEQEEVFEDESLDFQVRRQKYLPAVIKMQEEERARQVGIINKERIACRRSEARDKKLNRDLANQMETDERNRRLGERMFVVLGDREDRMKAGKLAQKMERHERFTRIKEAHDAVAESQKLRAAGKLRAAELEEVARKEKLQVCGPSLVESFAEVRARFEFTKQLEEQERHRRVQEIEEESQFAQSYQEEASILDLVIVKGLEEQERKLRTSQPVQEAKLARQASQTDLTLVKQLEEAERERRIRDEVPALRAMF